MAENKRGYWTLAIIRFALLVFWTVLPCAIFNSQTENHFFRKSENGK